MGELIGSIIAGTIGLFLILTSVIGYARREVRVQLESDLHVFQGRAAMLISTVGLVGGVLTALGVAGYLGRVIPFGIAFAVAVVSPIAWRLSINVGKRRFKA